MKQKLLGILIIICSFLLIGCGKEMTAKDAVKDYLDNYITLDSTITKQLDDFVESEEELSDTQKETYKEILKKEYKSLTYEIESERYEGDTAYIKTKINVIDLYNAQQEAIEYFNNNVSEFQDENGNLDNHKYMNFRLDKMNQATKTITYEIEFKVIKDNNNWVITQLSNDDLQKIHGIYNEE